jgi:hypothetical protein
MSDAIKALVKAQQAMGAVLKNASNPHLKSKYADLGSVLDACQGALHSNGFAIMQPCGKDEQGAYVETALAHESGDIFASRVYLVIGKNDMQGVGSAITYARRYGLLGMAGLAPEDDDGEATKAPKGKPETKQDAPPAEAPRDPVKIADGIIAAFAKAATVADLDAGKATGTKIAAAWDWLEQNDEAQAQRVTAACAKRYEELQKKPADDLGGDNLPY